MILTNKEAPGVPEGWTIIVQKDLLDTLVIRAPNGYAASVTSLDRNPANVLHMLACALLKL